MTRPQFIVQSEENNGCVNCASPIDNGEEYWVHTFHATETYEEPCTWDPNAPPAILPMELWQRHCRPCWLARVVVDELHDWPFSAVMKRRIGALLDFIISIIREVRPPATSARERGNVWRDPRMGLLPFDVEAGRGEQR